MAERLKILFLCTGNSCRSQMAEGWTRHLKTDQIDAYSAGTKAQGLNPLAVKVMAEAGIDISRHSSKALDQLEVAFNYVVTVCSAADHVCPQFPGKTKVVHVGFDDPPHLAQRTASEEEALQHYRRVRDEIGEFVRQLPEYLDQQ
ncbi:MAG: arsenate reductase ArsC [Lentisphaeria bacterium]|jgi:arsenate reductase|nr:arsenate reductase ArsC [Lentisphaeria bacterium]MDP7741571.1 arsenate reductase ArsC [Lentisphaeria bacterium]